MKDPPTAVKSRSGLTGGSTFAEKVLRVPADRELSMSQQCALAAKRQPTTSQTTWQGAQPEMEQSDHSPLVTTHGTIPRVSCSVLDSQGKEINWSGVSGGPPGWSEAGALTL